MAVVALGQLVLNLLCTQCRYYINTDLFHILVIIGHIAHIRIEQPAAFRVFLYAADFESS